MKIPQFDLMRQMRRIGPEIEEAIGEVLASGRFILGPKVQELEEKLAGLHSKKYGVGVASGTDALVLSLRALGIGPGDEVITTPFTFTATAAAIMRVGAKPVFIDIDRDTWNLDPWLVDEAFTPRTRAILPVHLFGLPAKVELLPECGLPVVEDAAQAICATPIGLGTVVCLSFYPTKNLGGLGDGGMILTDDEALVQHIDVLRRQGSRRKYHCDEIGYNSRLDEIQAAALLVKLKYLPEWNARRRELAALYSYRLGTDLPPGSVFHQFTIRHSKRGRLRKYLAEAGVGTAVYYPTPLYRQPAFLNPALYLPVTEEACSTVLSLPMFPELTDDEAIYVTEKIRSFADD